MCAPKYLWFINHLYSLGEALQYSAAVSKRNGVVGNSGKNMPNTPNISVIVPKMAQKVLIEQLLNNSNPTKLILKVAVLDSTKTVVKFC